MKIEIKNRYTGEIILCGEYESIKDCLEKNRSANLSNADLRYANLRYADLRYADLSNADLSNANLRYADLRYADLRYADMSNANLSNADLSYVNLRYANLDKRYIQVACIGSRKGMTTYCFDDDFIWCGCWSGNLIDFEKRVKETYKEKDNKHRKEYLGFIKYLRSLK